MALAAAVPIIGAGIGAIGGALASRRQRRRADALENEGLGQVRADRDARDPLRDEASRMLMQGNQAAPHFNFRQYGVSDEARGARGNVMDALGAVGGGASRGDIASQYFQNFMGQAEDAGRIGTQQVGQDASRLGRVGSGMVTTSLGDLNERIQTNLMREGRGLAADAAAGDISDRHQNLYSALSASGQMRGEDLDEGRFGLGKIGMQRDFYDRDVANRFGQIDRLSGIGFQSPNTYPYMAASGRAQGRADQISQGWANFGSELGRLGQGMGQGGQRRPQMAPQGGAYA